MFKGANDEETLIFIEWVDDTRGSKRQDTDNYKNDNKQKDQLRV